MSEGERIIKKKDLRKLLIEFIDKGEKINATMVLMEEEGITVSQAKKKVEALIEEVFIERGYVKTEKGFVKPN